jgi:hypothetical protein
MLKSFLLIILLFSIRIGFAQFDLGEWKLGLSTNVGATNNGPEVIKFGFGQSKMLYQYKNNSGTVYTDRDYFNTFGVNLSPRVGYTFWNNGIAGIDLHYNYGKVLKNQHDYELEQVIGGAGLFLRGYFVSIKKINLFLEASSGYSRSKYRSSIESVKSRMFNFGLMPGLTFFIGEKFSIDMGIAYDFINEKILSTMPYDVLKGDRSDFHSLTFEVGFIGTIN